MPFSNERLQTYKTFCHFEEKEGELDANKRKIRENS